MSHSNERKEKNCLNCNARLHGRYCSICGQENLEPQETVWHMVAHFFNDITHFDGKFFSSVKYLFTRPGFLTKEYGNGRRASYLNPVRMYIFTSAFFFLLYFSFFSRSPSESPPPKQAKEKAVITSDTVRKQGPLADTVKYGHNIMTAIRVLATGVRTYNNRGEYDALLAAGKLKDGFFRRIWERKILSIKARYGDNNEIVQNKIEESFRHYVPQMFFLSLPLIALFLKLFYIRRKQFYYTAHFIFAVHLYVFVYLAVLLLLIINWLSGLMSFHWPGWVQALAVLLILYYCYRAMRNFYEQGRGKTILKYIFLMFSMFIVLMLLTVGMLFFFFFKL